MDNLYIIENNGKKRSATEVKCCQCGILFLKANVYIKRRPNSKHYCSKECFDNRQKNHIDVECIQCGKKFSVTKSRFKRSKSGLLFCSVDCKNLGQKIENCHPNMMPSHYNKGHSTYRNRAFRNYDCICSHKDCNVDIKEILEVHHIDGDRNNNSLDNLIILCPNHHKMITMGLAIINESREFKLL